LDLPAGIERPNFALVTVYIRPSHTETLALPIHSIPNSTDKNLVTQHGSSRATTELLLENQVLLQENQVCPHRYSILFFPDQKIDS
jgi:hypothetical protein